ncbi:hypothetical protein CHARACLAT_019227 [Characodon lateralis]|uniref:Uncharacterized protein n=1 Tax=Characodon lateralis TaxID=208331 RepID=A0ABU7F7H1_9TELE|nr:hypothetical protein [Characodon lateralis]
MAWESVSAAPWTPPSRNVPSTSHWEEAQGMAQDTLEGLCLSNGLGKLQASPRGAGEDVWGEGSLLLRLQPCNPLLDKRKMTYMSKLSSIFASNSFLGLLAGPGLWCVR